MPLSDDQRAMLRLLAQREQGYEDIAALMGLSVEDVRAKVRDALAQLEQEGVEAPPLPSEPDPEPAAPEPPPPIVPPAPLDPAVQAAESMVPVPESSATPSEKASSPRDKGMLIALAGGAIGLVVIVVLAVLLISNSGGDDSGDATNASTANPGTERNTSGGNGKAEPTLAVLEPVDGSGASGTGLFANFEETLVLAIEAKGLEPTAKGTRYTIWIAASPSKMLPVASTAVGADGRIEASVKLPAELLLFLADETYKEIAITRTDTARLAAESDKSKAPAYTGDAVLRGTITGPLVGAAELLRKAEEEAAAE